ncbi:MAG: biotin--[acetyl-CoA-carboxylase] ligase [Candidatus Krumholzibacteriota bacterium]|nr:biotin--[acetyl-CoA-carboxylase] ligase [Candidatus Krumholzibacteriota bacterium]
MEKRSAAAGLSGGIELHPARIMNMISAARFGTTVILCEEVDSTNRIAAEAAAGGAPEGTLFVALRQYSGRGRKGREWFSTEAGSLVFSIILRPQETPESLTTLMGLAAAQTIDEFYPGIETSIKWPNDIFISGTKVAGILAESRGKDVIVGIGIDVNETEDDFPVELKSTAVSLRIASGSKLDRGMLLAAIVDRFEILYTRWEMEGLSIFRFDIEKKLLWKGMEASIETGDGDFSGTVSGVTSEGYLRIRSNGEERIFRAGDLSLRVEER